MEITPESKAVMARHTEAAAEAHDWLWEALAAAASVGADSVAKSVQTGGTWLVPRHGGMGLAGSVMAWEIDREGLVMAVGVPKNTPAARYASIQETGGTIFPKSGRSLAIPLTREAENSAGPRSMDGLTLIPRKGRSPLLVRVLGRTGTAKGWRIVPHWVLVPKVRIKPTWWFTRSMREAAGKMNKAFGSRLRQFVGSMKGG